MIRRNDEMKVDARPQMYGGEGTVELRHMLTGPEEMNGKGRLFSLLMIQPGESIGWHVHEDEAETFYVVNGVGEFNDNGEVHTLFPGDILHTPAGHGHAVTNTGDDVLEFVGMIIYK